MPLHTVVPAMPPSKPTYHPDWSDGDHL